MAISKILDKNSPSQNPVDFALSVPHQGTGKAGATGTKGHNDHVPDMIKNPPRREKFFGKPGLSKLSK